MRYLVLILLTAVALAAPLSAHADGGAAFDAALAELDKVIHDYPNSDLAIDAQIRKVDTKYYRVGDFDLAIQEYEKIVTAHPTDAWGTTALWNMASALERKWEESEGEDLGALDASEQALREIVERGADPGGGA